MSATDPNKRCSIRLWNNITRGFIRYIPVPHRYGAAKKQPCKSSVLPICLAQLAAEDRFLPDYVQQEFTDYLKCGRLEHGFLRVRCESCHHEKLVAFSCKRRGFCPSCGARRMVEEGSEAP